MLLFVKWRENKSESYYVDKDRYSRVHEEKNEFIYDAYCGTYHFDKNTHKVTLDTGADIRNIDVIEWFVEVG